jgi:hypothetical protein
MGIYIVSSSSDFTSAYENLPVRGIDYQMTCEQGQLRHDLVTQVIVSAALASARPMWPAHQAVSSATGTVNGELEWVLAKWPGLQWDQEIDLLCDGLEGDWRGQQLEGAVQGSEVVAGQE